MKDARNKAKYNSVFKLINYINTNSEAENCI